MMQYVMILFMNGYPTEVDHFRTLPQCEEKLAQYKRAQSQHGYKYKVWCERIKNVPTV